jgi:hypothetical protein
MNEPTRLTIQVLLSAALIFGVIWWMWRIPGKPVLDSATAPFLALLSIWVSMGSVITGIWLWYAANPDQWVVIDVGIWSAGLSMAILALWIYRHTPAEQTPEPIHLQRLQARLGMILGMLGIMLWYAFILIHKAPLTPIGS